MLMIATSLRQLNWSQLMALYEEGNRENGKDLYPHLSAGQQLLHAEQDFYDYLKNGFFIQPGDRYCLWSEAGIYVSALRLERYQDGLLLEALETHPAYRGRGYAKKLVAAVLERVDEKVYSHISRILHNVIREPSRNVGISAVLLHDVAHVMPVAVEELNGTEGRPLTAAITALFRLKENVAVTLVGETEDLNVRGVR